MLQKMKKKCEDFFLPVHWMLPVIFTFLLNNTVYFGVRPFMEGKYHYNLSCPADQLVPFLPQFILVYFGCYLFWVVNYCMIAKQEKEHRYRFFTADFYARLVCLLCFVLFPTTNTRPVLSGDGIWIRAVEFLYRADAPTNLFPSIHCMASWFSYIGIRGRKNIPGWYRKFSCVFAWLVFVSTLALRQHVIIDVIGGAALAEITFYISRRTKGYLVYGRIFERAGDIIMAGMRGQTNGKQEKNDI